MKINFTEEQMPDATTLLKLLHLLEKYGIRYDLRKQTAATKARGPFQFQIELKADSIWNWNYIGSPIYKNISGSRRMLHLR